MYNINRENEIRICVFLNEALVVDWVVAAAIAAVAYTSVFSPAFMVRLWFCWSIIGASRSVRINNASINPLLRSPPKPLFVDLACRGRL